MIQPLQSNSISFKGVEASPALKARLNSQASQQQSEVAVKQEPKKKFSITETYHNAKKGAVNLFKGVNNVTNVTGGVVRGAAEGAVATALVGVVGKAVSEARNESGLKVIGHIVGQSLKDVGKGAWNAIKFTPSIITKSPLENIKTILSLPKKFFAKEYVLNEKVFKGYLSGHKGAAAQFPSAARPRKAGKP